MDEIDPGIEWYSAISAKKGLPPRCPFASTHRCPRYYLSLALLEHTGATAIDPEEDRQLLEHWKTTDVWPSISEQHPSIFGNPGHQIFNHFCPEVSFDRFGIFASHLADYADDIDRQLAHSRLGKDGQPSDHWRWSWASMQPSHYTECPLYSLLASQSPERSGRLTKTKRVRKNMNLTEEQKDLLRKIVEVYEGGCRADFLVTHTFGGSSLLYPGDQPAVEIEASDTDFEQLQAEGLISLGHTSSGSLRGKPTKVGIATVEKDFRIERTNIRQNLGPGAGKIFIGHGGSPIWRELKDFLSDRLGLEWDEFNRESAAGIPTQQRLEEMLENACFAFLVMSGEDEHSDGTKHARENVIHEAGLFQGRLGFKRAIVLLEEGCRQFSNIHGLTHISFSIGKLQAAFEEIRRVLEREAIIEPR